MFWCGKYLFFESLNAGTRLNANKFQTLQIMLTIFHTFTTLFTNYLKNRQEWKTQTPKLTLTNVSQSVKSLKRVFGFPVSESLYVATETAEDEDKAVAWP